MDNHPYQWKRVVKWHHEVRNSIMKFIYPLPVFLCVFAIVVYIA